MSDPHEPATTDPRRALPPVSRLVDAAALAGVDPERVVEASRSVLAEARERGEAAPLPELAERVRRLVLGDRGPALRRVLNGTGVLIHTNLGRSPLPEESLSAALSALAGYSDLEWDAATGERGTRGAECRRRLARLYGAEASLVVGNAAGGVLLALSALAAGGEVVVSRGELVAIGGGFRIPEILALSGARLVEVGTTNRTELRDVAAAIGPETRLLLRAELSNFEQRGFVSRPTVRELARLAESHAVPLVVDLGHGSPDDLSRFGLAVEPVGAVLVDGAGLVVASGDKLLGGPQAGILAGRSELVARCAAHPLLRALRPGSFTYALLGAVAGEWLAGTADRSLPLRRMLAATTDELERRGAALLARLGPREPRLRVEPSVAVVGGGTTPGSTLPSRAITLLPESGAEELSAKLRRGEPPIAGRIEEGRVLIDLRTILPEQDGDLAIGLDAVCAKAQSAASSIP